MAGKEGSTYTPVLSLSCQVNKDDLLSMVRYGAELVFSSEATNITGGWGGTWLCVWLYNCVGGE